jgi:phage tail-like protein
MEEDKQPAVTVCFTVQIDDQDSDVIKLGSFNSCEGLGVEVVMEQREEGGANDRVHHLPTRIKYSNIKLSRPICDDTQAVIRWISGLPINATIQAMTADDTIVATWQLQGVIPVRWTGPSLNRDSLKVATETLEIAHHGFDSTKPKK